jgi:uncharacterized protein YneF (UPF0154 family)
MESQTKTILTVVVLIVLALAGAMYYRSQKMIDDANTPPIEEEGVACTMDAMECPDGSYVGRTAPDCEFAPCPGTVPTY